MVCICLQAWIPVGNRNYVASKQAPSVGGRRRSVAAAASGTQRPAPHAEEQNQRHMPLLRPLLRAVIEATSGRLSSLPSGFLVWLLSVYSRRWLPRAGSGDAAAASNWFAEAYSVVAGRLPELSVEEVAAALQTVINSGVLDLDLLPRLFQVSYFCAVQCLVSFEFAWILGACPLARLGPVATHHHELCGASVACEGAKRGLAGASAAHT